MTFFTSQYLVTHIDWNKLYRPFLVNTIIVIAISGYRDSRWRHNWWCHGEWMISRPDHDMESDGKLGNLTLWHMFATICMQPNIIGIMSCAPVELKITVQLYNNHHVFQTCLHVYLQWHTRTAYKPVWQVFDAHYYFKYSLLISFKLVICIQTTGNVV